MQNKIAIVLASTAAVAVTALAGWQSWNTHQLQQQVAGLQQQLATQPGAPITPPAATPASPLPLGQATPAPRNNAPLTYPGASDPWGGDDPFAEMERMQQQMHQHMQQLMSGFGLGKSADPLFDLDAFNGGSGFRSSMGFGAEPDFAFKENADNYQLTINVPQGSNVEISTEVHDRDLTVEGSITSQQQDNGNGRSLRARQTQQFARTLRLPADADPLGISTRNDKDKVVVTVAKKTPGKKTVSMMLPNGNFAF